MKPTKDLTHLSILSNFDKATIFNTPYPYIVIKNALPEDLYNSLDNNFPAVGIVANGRELKDTWYDYPACKVLKDERITNQWKNFFRYHTSDTFFYEFVDKLGYSLMELHPSLESKVGKSINNFRVGMRPGGRGDPLAKDADISMGRHINFCGDISKELFNLSIPKKLQLKIALAKTPGLWRLADKIR